MIRRVLVANRGAAARRVFATCRLVGIETVAVHSDADAASPHVDAADWAVHLPGNAPTATYLRGDLIIAAAHRAGADAVHPGWGYLAADPEFATAVADAGLTWVGPPGKILAALADRRAVTARLAEVGIPVLPGSGQLPPGGGEPYLAGDPPVEPTRRIDVQVVVDAHGNSVVFGERECSVRRSQQRLLAETPSPVVPPELREELTATAVNAAVTLGYVGAATVELVLGPDGSCYVLDVSPRLPAEHAVTECAAGLDLVRLLLLVAEGGPLPYSGAPPIRGHTIGVQLRAEDPAYAWQPTAGTLHRFQIGPIGGEFKPLPVPGLRLDAGVAGGGTVGLHHDASLATLVAWAPSRYEAARLLAMALARARIHGVITNRDLLVRVLRNPAFLAGAADTGFLDDHPEVFAPLLSSVDGMRLSCLAAALAAAAERRAHAPLLGSLPSGWRNVPSGAQTAVYSGPMGTVEIGYRLDRTGELQSWWARAVDPDELDLAGLGQPSSLPDDHPPVAVVSAGTDRVVLDVSGVRLTYWVHRVGDLSYVDGTEGSVALTEVPRYPIPVPLDDDPG